MQKVEVEVGFKYGKRKKIRFTGEEITYVRFLPQPNHDSRGTLQRLYKRPDGRYLVLTEEWSHWIGEDNSNYTELSPVLTTEELIDQYGVLASKAGIMEEEDLD